jgi:hypothetical protein
VIAGTGGDQQYKAFSFKDIYLQSGIQKLKVFIDKGGINIDYIEVRESVVTSAVDFLQPKVNFLYPNPANDKVSINVNTNAKMIVRIVSLHGQLVRLFKLSPENENVISISDLAKGIYIVWVISDGKIFKDKLIKL